MKSFSFQDRLKNLKRLENEELDIFVIGGGITGAGVARDAAMRGMRVGLVEASDFASGTSSRSSKLVHGGIRYLENMEFKLVFEALSERQKLFNIAPHLVHPLRFMIPLYQSGRVGMFKMGLGMWLYDALSLFQAPEMHERLNRAESSERMPTLQSQELLGSYVYSDAYMDDDRLVHETLRSANQFDAIACNYVKATGVDLDENKKVKAVSCQDVLTGHAFKVKAKHVVSSVGPWTDKVGHDFFKSWKDILRPTKGVHLTFEKKRLPLSSAVVMGAEKRIVFGIPRHEMVIIGTTDTDYKGDPGQVGTTAEDVKYLLGVVDQYFPGANIKASDIVASYAGVRPLVQDESQSEGKTSREHTIFTDEHNITFVAGGKYTTYRLMAQQIVQECLKYFSIEEKVKYNQCKTNSPLNPLVTVDTRLGDFETVRSLGDSTRLSESERKLLVDRHGLEALKIIENFNPHLTYWQFEAAHAIENTMCLNLIDFYTRRVPLFLADRHHGLSVLNEIIVIFQSMLGWTSQQAEQERKKLETHIHSELAWKKNF